MVSLSFVKPRDVLSTAPLAPLKQITKRLVIEPMRNFMYVRESVLADNAAQAGDEIKKMRMVRPPERIPLGDPATDPFIPISKYYKDGWCDHPGVFVCEVPDARLHVPSGMVCTRGFRVLADRGLEDRLPAYSAFGERKPRSMPKWEGPHATIQYSLAYNPGHWMVDCLPRLHNFDLALPGVALTILMPRGASEFQRELLEAVLPRRFRVRWDVAEPWVQCSEFYWSSLVSARCMNRLPREYIETIRAPVFRKFGPTGPHRKRRRLYISRRRARYRRVLNEETMLRLLESYGFEEIDLEKLSFREEVELFHEAEVVLGPHGAGFAGLFFAGEIDVVVLYPTRVPPNYFHTMAGGLGQRHHFVCHDEKDEDDSFSVDIPALKAVLEVEIGLKMKRLPT